MGKLPKERISGGQRSSASWGAALSDLLRTKTRVNDCTLCPIDPEMDSVPPHKSSAFRSPFQSRRGFRRCRRPVSLTSWLPECRSSINPPS
jgi:hypothetical protein